MKTIKLQPSSFVDNMREGHEMTRLPYPFFVNEEGEVGQQDMWDGDPARVIGFQRDLAVQAIDLWWKDAVKDPQQAVGMYLVTSNAEGDWASHSTAIASAEIVG